MDDSRTDVEPGRRVAKEMRSLRFDPRFSEDLCAAMDWYEGVSAQAAEKLRAALADRFESLRMFPESYSLFFGTEEHRGASIKGFPWAIVFRIEGDFVRVIRFVHLSSDWQNE